MTSRTLKDRRRELESAKEFLGINQRRHNEVKSEVEALHKELASLRHGREKASVELETIRSELSLHKHKLSSGEDSLRLGEERARELGRRIAMMESDLARLSKQSAEAKKQAFQAEQSLNLAQQEEQSARKGAEDAEEEREAKAVECHRLEKQLQGLRKAKMSTGAGVRRLEAQEKEMVLHCKRAKEKEKWTRQQCQLALDDLGKLQSEGEKVLALVESKQSEVARETGNLQQKRKSLKTNIQMLITERSRLRDAVSKLESELQSAQRVRESIAEVGMLRREKDRLAVELEEERERTRSAKAGEKAKEEVLRGDLAVERKSSAKLQETLSALQRRVKDASRKQNEARAMEEGLRQQSECR